MNENAVGQSKGAAVRNTIIK
jgi:hypothetical protein